MKLFIKNSGMIAAALLLAPAISMASAGIPSSIKGEFKDPQNQVSMKLEPGAFGGGKITMQADGKKREFKIVDVSEAQELAKMMAPKPDPRSKKPVPKVAPSAAFSTVYSDNSQETFMIVPTGEQREEAGLIWYSADVTILQINDIKAREKAAEFEALRCQNGFVMIDTMALDFASSFEVGCDENEVALRMKRTK